MPILRNGQTAADYQTPDVYIIEQTPKLDEVVVVPEKVMAIFGRFQKGPVDQIMMVNKGNYKTFAGDFDSAYEGARAAYVAFQEGVTTLALVNIRGAGAVAASLTIQSTEATPKNSVTITHKHLGKYGNRATVTIEAGTNANTQKITLEAPFSKTEVYDNVISAKALVDQINAFSVEYTATLAAGQDAVKLKALSKEPLIGGDDGTAPTATHYKGTVDAQGRRTGLELLKTSVLVTDFVFDTTVSDIANTGAVDAAEKMNVMAYLQSDATSVATAVTARNAFNTEFAHLNYGIMVKSKSGGFLVPAAVYDCIAHIITDIQDGTAGHCFNDIDTLTIALSPDDVALKHKGIDVQWAS